MTAGQPLRGLVGQGINGRRPKAFSYVSNYSIGLWTFQVPRTGKWKFVAWGVGGTSGASSPAGGSGGYTEITRFLAKGQQVTISVPGFAGGSTPPTTLTMPDGTIASATAASGPTPGLGVGGDVNLTGTVGTYSTGLDGGVGSGTGGGRGGTHIGTNDGGAGAPANAPFHGGQGGDAAGNEPGVGGGSAQGSTSHGTSMAIAQYFGP